MVFRLKRRTIIHIRLSAKTTPFFQLKTLVRNKSLRWDFPFKKRPFFLINKFLGGVGTGLEQVDYFLVPLVFQQFQVAFQLFLHFVLHLHDSLAWFLCYDLFWSVLLVGTEFVFCWGLDEVRLEGWWIGRRRYLFGLDGWYELIAQFRVVVLLLFFTKFVAENLKQGFHAHHAWCALGIRGVLEVGCVFVFAVVFDWIGGVDWDFFFVFFSLCEKGEIGFLEFVLEEFFHAEETVAAGSLMGVGLREQFRLLGEYGNWGGCCLAWFVGLTGLFVGVKLGWASRVSGFVFLEEMGVGSSFEL